VALVAAYAIVLHGFLLGFSPIPVAAAASGDDSSSFALCLHDLVGGGFTPQAPGAPASGDVHCKFCIAQVHSMALAPTLEAQIIFRISGETIRFVRHEGFAGLPRYFQKQPRGPPPAA
jgi:hypothetical protein